MVSARIQLRKCIPTQRKKNHLHTGKISPDHSEWHTDSVCPQQGLSSLQYNHSHTDRKLCYQSITAAIKSLPCAFFLQDAITQIALWLQNKAEEKANRSCHTLRVLKGCLWASHCAFSSPWRSSLPNAMLSSPPTSFSGLLGLPDYFLLCSGQKHQSF